MELCKDLNDKRISPLSFQKNSLAMLTEIAVLSYYEMAASNLYANTKLIQRDVVICSIYQGFISCKRPNKILSF